ncbi:hypothetical protein ACOMHN_006724 [Nucella lapillus]
MCLNHLATRPPDDQGEVDTLPSNPVRVCQRHPACRWCLYVCERPEDNFTNSTSCHRDCRHTRTRPGSRGRQSCAQACRFLERAGRAKGGTCPAPGTLRGFQSACVASCGGDSACGRAAEKCCDNTCGRVCVQPLDVHILPPVPGNLRFKLLKTGGVLITWRPGEGEGGSGGDPPARQQTPSGDSRAQPAGDGVSGGGGEPGGGEVPGGGREPGGGGKPGGGGVSGGGGVVGGDMEPAEGGERGGGAGGDSLKQTLPVLYIFRWWCPYTSGAVTSVTDRARTRIQGYPAGIYPGSKCHFMVAAVNLHGSRGFSTVSPYIKQFLLPSPALHLEQVRSRVHDGKVDVTIQWQPPVYTDGLPVFKYQVFWSGSLPRASPSYMRLHMHKRVLSADRHSFVLQSLNMGTIYFVQVRAVVRWKKRQKVGKPASTYIETYAPPQPADVGEEREERGRGRGVGRQRESVIHSVSVNQSFYDHTVLKTRVTWTLQPGKNARKYLIYWKADSCARNEHRKTHPRLETSATSHARTFTLYNLRPQCEYAVRVHAVNSRGQTRAATVTSFLTPSCHLIPVKGGQPPECHTAEIPSEVQGLHAETSDCLTVVRWQSPSPPTPPLHTYHVMWGRTEGGRFSAAAVIYTSTPHQLNVSANETSATLGRLRAGDHYTIQVRGVSQGGRGPPSILPLHVPHPDLPCPYSSESSSVLDDDQPDPTVSQSNTTDDVITNTVNTTSNHDDNITSPPPQTLPTTTTHSADISDDTLHPDDEDDVYFSGGGDDMGDRQIGNQTDVVLIPGVNIKADNEKKWPNSNTTDLNLGARDLINDNAAPNNGGTPGVNVTASTPGQNSFRSTSPTSAGVPGTREGGVGGAIVGRTCWFSVVASVMLSVCVCVALLC